MKLVPYGWPKPLFEVRGLFQYEETIGFATNQNHAYEVATGTAFWGPADGKGREARDALMVQPLRVVPDDG